MEFSAKFTMELPDGVHEAVYDSGFYLSVPNAWIMVFLIRGESENTMDPFVKSKSYRLSPALPARHTAKLWAGPTSFVWPIGSGLENTSTH